ncbi:MAG: hypothetical protein FWG70_11890 [Oscillospiraceae bacterium]|nr:hypothetical protein [Oscillospiraceae bacterium]
MFETILRELILPLIGIGGIGLAAFNGILHRKKNKAETGSVVVASAEITLKNATKLEAIAIERYTAEARRYEDAMKKLDEAGRLIDEARAELIEARKELESERKYNSVLIGVLEENGIEIPKKNEETQ